jgi:ribosomal 50S subunit-associated protein YjgA (DUF615 family)
MFTRLRIALELAGNVEKLNNDVEELTGIVNSLRMEWTDTLDKLLAREERWRKRYKAEVDRALVDNTNNSSPDTTHADKGQLRSLVAARRAQRG